VSFSSDGVVFSLPDAVAKVLEKHIKRADKQMTLDLPAPSLSAFAKASADGSEDTIEIKSEIRTEKVVETISEEKISGSGSLTYKKTQKISIANLGNAPVCPSCANMMLMAEGCMKCEHCGFSKCG
jgi:hypothetical protein